MERKILYVDLSKREHWTEALDSEADRLLLGGRGITAFLAYKNLDKQTDPLSPEAPLILAPGYLVGWGFPTASKTIVAGRSPLTGLLGRSSVGARLGMSLNWYGIASLVVKGALDNPGILLIEGERVYIKDSGSLWGKTIGETRQWITSRYPGWHECVIGPAGENLSAIALIDCNGRQAGRTGLGAVMGSKKLKAILVKPPRPPRLPEHVRSVVGDWSKRLGHTGAITEYGTPLMASLTEMQGVFPGKNWTRSTLEWCGDRDTARTRFSTYAGENRVARNPCPQCTRPCSQVVMVDGKEVDGPEYELVYSLGSNLGFCNPEAAARLNLLADELGLDGISLGATLAWAIEAGEKGILKGAPGWGDLEGLERLTRDIAYRRGPLGELLADGSVKAAERLGKGIEFTVHSKRLELPAYDARGLKGMALGYAVSSRGGDHLTSGVYAVELTSGLWIFKDVDPLSWEGKHLLVKAMEDLFAAYDVLGVCKFSRKELGPEQLAEAVSALRGEKWSGGMILRVGERVVTLERIVNQRLGLTPIMDTLSHRLSREPISDGPRRGEVVEEDRLEEAKRLYYTARLWTPDGTPSWASIVVNELDRLGVEPP